MGSGVPEIILTEVIITVAECMRGNNHDSSYEGEGREAAFL